MATDVDFSKIKHVDPLVIDLVNGHAKQMQSSLPSSAYFNITPLITNMIIIYYYIGEYFEKCSEDKFLSISGKDKCILSKDSDTSGGYRDYNRDYDNVSYGHQWVPSNVAMTCK